jgi:cytosine/adenosine deaminase-related metal-dependent hydrolase
VAASLVRGKHIVCRISGQNAAVVLDDAAVYQEDGTIVDVGPYADLAAKYRPDDHIGSNRDVVMPGLVDAHHHVGLTPFQLGSPDHPLELWFASRLAGRDVDFYLDTLYSAFEHLEAGVTTVHHLTSRLGPASNWPEAAAKVLKAYQDIGLRVAFSPMVRDQNRLVYGPDDDFVRSLAPGSAADMVLVDWGSVAYPYLDPDVPVVDALVHRARPAGVRTVIVAGEVILRDGKSTRLDKRAMLDELAASLRVSLTPAERRRREVSRELIPHVAHFYDGWLDE